MSRPQAESAWPPALFGQARVRVPAPGKLAALFEPLVVYLFVVVQRISYRLQSFRTSRVHIKVFLAVFRNKSRGGKKRSVVGRGIGDRIPWQTYPVAVGAGGVESSGFGLPQKPAAPFKK